jgi:hypothetical protein
VTQLRVAQWASGNIGTRAMKAVIEHPDLELAGVLVYDPAKVGVDAGALCGLDETGVLATADADEIVALGADCVLHMPRSMNFDDVARLLSAGSNVVTTCGGLHHPPSMDEATRDLIEHACAAGDTSVYATGSSPGFITEAIPLALTSIQRRLDCLTIDEFANLSPRDSPDLLFNIMGFGQPPAAYDENRLAHLKAGFGPSLRQLADAIGIEVDAVNARGEVAVAARPIEIAAGVVEAGTVAAMRTTVAVESGGREALRFRATWYCGTDLDTDWELQDTGWRINVEGDTPLDVTLRFPVSLEQMAATTPGYTAHRAVNAVNVVCASASGIQTTAELPHIIANLR